MGNVFTKKKQYRQLTFAPYVEHDNHMMASAIEYHEYNDIQGLQEQIDNMKKHYNTVLETRIINLEENIRQIKNVFNDVNTRLANLRELSDMQSRDLESLLNNDNLLRAKVEILEDTNKSLESRVSMLEEKVKYDQFVNSEVDEFLSTRETHEENL